MPLWRAQGVTFTLRFFRSYIKPRLDQATVIDKETRCLI